MSSHSHVIAVVDDDEISLLLIKKIFERKQSADNFLLFSNAFNALGYLEDNANNPVQLPTVLLLDITMPLMSGWQFLKEFEKIKFTEGYTPPIFIVSASINVDFEMLRKYPFVKGYFLKPVIPDKLNAKLESLKLNKRVNIPVGSEILQD